MSATPRSASERSGSDGSPAAVARDAPDDGAPDRDGPATAPDDMKAKYRQALERKNARRAGGQGADGRASSKVSGGAHGPAHQQRTFRRKSG